ncbi:SrtC [Lactococcus garvieae TRF1]|uniref:SrtC n=1 Tax=Lactococcus garvieae TRF1 TaxID=1380772 RepID=V8AUF1_9LACT|nr:SrtC [Lactococcus garvieae TRF1]
MRDKSTDKKRERRFSLRNVISTLLLIFALGLLFYPIFVNYMVAQQNKTTIQKYTRNVETLEPAQAKHLKEEAALYNQYIYTKSQYQSWNKAVPEYKKQLITDNDKVIAYLSIPQIKITNIPVYSGDSEETLAAGVGHIPQTSLPIGGENTHAVLSAHSGHINNTLFSDLEDLKMKDVFYIHVLDQTLKYEIFERKIVNPEDTDAINVIPGKDLVTLVTCWPTGINNKRLLVTGRRVATNTMTSQEHIQRNKYGYNFWVMLLASGLALCALGLVLRNILGAKNYNMRIDRAQFDAIQQGKQELIIAPLPQGSKKYRLKDKVTLIAAEALESNKRQYFAKSEGQEWQSVNKSKEAEKQKVKITQIIDADEFNKPDKHLQNTTYSNFKKAAEQLLQERLNTKPLPENCILIKVKVKE